MIAELGQLCLCLAFASALLQALIPALDRLSAPHRLPGLVRTTALLQWMLVTAAFAGLIHSYAVSDFSVMNVLLNSHSAKPLIYKITGAWGNHEGSMLLWAWILASYGLLLALLHSHDSHLDELALSLLGAIAAGLLAFILFTSNPFLRIFPIPAEGQDLNPLLQDIGLALHPPVLYLGYVGFAVVFSYACAGLLRCKLDSAWARQVHPFVLLPWATLTLGIGAGSWWAYRELGWGGWWFWDPVENVALLPWLSATALLHANIVLMRRGQLAGWVALLAILTFGLALIGTFIVRSGLITSVHAFASDPTRGIFILAYIAATTGGALALYAARPLTAGAPVRIASRGGMMLIGNAILIAAAFSILIAILYPLLLQWVGAPSVSVGAPYFNATFLPMMAPLLILGGLAPLLPWDRFTIAQFRRRALQLLPASLVAAILVLAVAEREFTLAFGGLVLGFWMILGSIAVLRRALRATSLFSPRGLHLLAGVLAHAGIGVLALGITATGLFKQSYEAPLNASAPLQFGIYQLRLIEAERVPKHNYITRRARFAIEHDGRRIAELSPEMRYYPARDMHTTEAALYSTPLRDLYLVIGDAPTPEGSEPRLGVRMYVTPGQQWIWLAFILVALGGICGFTGSWIARQEET